LHGTMVQVLNCFFKPDILFVFFLTVEIDPGTRAQVTGLESLHFIHCSSDTSERLYSLRLGCYPARQQVYRTIIEGLYLCFACTTKNMWRSLSSSV
jgi:hypothetical protein